MTSHPASINCGVNNETLQINEACLYISSSLPHDIDIYLRSVECYNCNYTKQTVVPAYSSISQIVDTSYAVITHVEPQLNFTCTQTSWFEDFGVYDWKIEESNCNDITTSVQPERFWVNIGIVLAAILTVLIAHRSFSCIIRRAWWNQVINRNAPFQELESDLGNPGSRTRNLARTRRLTRVATIDVFRGISLTMMVFVNYGGGKYSLFKHAPWNGLTVADVVFPFFIWIMGVSVVIAQRSQLRAAISKKHIFQRILRRMILLISIGLILNSGKDTPLRIPGVLQRIGLTYFLIASIELFFSKPQRNERFGPWNSCAELVDAAVQWIIVALFVTAHILLTFLLPVPDCPTGYLGPGGLDTKGENCTGGAAGYIDRLIFTPAHVYQHPTSEKIFHSYVPYDPEGLLGVLTSVLAAFLGVHCGRIILTYERTTSRIKRWLGAAIFTGLIAGFLCSWDKETGYIPINKNLWSLSYVMATCSIAFFVFTALYMIVDHWKIWNGGPFVYAGMNSIAIYIGHSVLNKQLPWRWSPFTSTHLEHLIMDTTATSIWLLIAFLLYRNNVFIIL